MGRPKKENKQDCIVFSLRIPTQEYTKIQERAEQNRQSLNNYILTKIIDTDKN